MTVLAVGMATVHMPDPTCICPEKICEALSHVCVGRAEAGRFPFLYSPLLSSPGIATSVTGARRCGRLATRKRSTCVASRGARASQLN
eukprot:jgi/Tetstr1/437883/TSEL_026522.t1